jgi:hypothetical protein
VVQEIARPYFWSYVVLNGVDRVVGLLNCLYAPCSKHGFGTFQLIKVVRLVNAFGKGSWREVYNREHPILPFLRSSPSLEHIHLHADDFQSTPIPVLLCLALRSEQFKPLEGLTGLVLTDENREAATLAIRRSAPSLRRLLVCTDETSERDDPEVVERAIRCSSEDYYADAIEVDLPELISLDLGSPRECYQPWLGHSLARLWRMPKLSKAGLTTRSDGKDIRASLLGPFDRSFQSVFLPSARDITRWHMKDIQSKEVAFGLDYTPICGIGLWLLNKRFTDSSVESVVLVEKGLPPAGVSSHQIATVRFVNKDKMPNLQKVVWVAAKKDDDAAAWPV